ncbi:MAG: dihydrolipoyl dehydrogenase [Deltaproteobacteria bacterium]|nr:dihydrolipoyl dehydrogenase [Deltaproteobacteria bacterium]
MKTFDMVIIGGGVAGLVAASGAAQLGAEVALIDRSPLGGDCLRYGCVPTKRLIRSAKVCHLVKHASEFGINANNVTVDFASVMQTLREVQAAIAVNDSPERFKKMGVEVAFGNGEFTDPQTFKLGNTSYKGRRFLIATGSSPVTLPIPGLKEAGALTNVTALQLTELPPSIAILGAGPIGIEFAQAFGRLGSRVTIIEKFDRILPREDPELTSILHKILEGEGVKIDTCTEVKDAALDNGMKVLNAACATGDKRYAMDRIMMAIGRSPNVEGLGLDTAGVEHDARKGIAVDRHLRTTERHIYAAGDCTGGLAFTHVAEYQAGIVISNALFPFVNRSVDYRVVPWVTYTDPELARVGMTEEEARRTHSNVRVYRHPFNAVDRAVIDGSTSGMIKLVCDAKMRILGAHILGPAAGELIHEYALAMKAGIPATKISQTIHAYPTLAQSIKRASDIYYRERLFSGRFKKLAQLLIRARRR